MAAPRPRPRPVRSLLARSAAGLTLALATLAAACLGPACTSDDGNAESDETTGAALSGAIFRLELDASSLCAGSIDRLEFATRRRSCWDPEVPCTSPTNPPWQPGTTRSCAELGGSQTWELAVEVSGQYETQLRALTADGSQEGINCYVDPSGQNGLTQVAKADVEMDRVFSLGESAGGMGCFNP